MNKQEKKDFFDYDSYINDKKKEKQTEPKKGKSTSAKHRNNNSKSDPLNHVNKKSAGDSNITIDKLKQDGHESIENIKKMFDAALNENIEEIAELTAEEPVPALPEQVSSDGIKRKMYFILGIVVSVLAVIGLVASINFSVSKIKAFADNTQQKNEFARFVYPIVICDPAPFNQTIKLRNETMLTAAIWDIILYEDKSRYTSEFDYIIVPEVDVEKHAINLLGVGLSFTHNSIIGPDIQFYYDEDIKSYRIPSNPKYFTYSPYIQNITRVGERYTVTVGYVSPTPAWLTLTSEDTPTPEKYMEYVISVRDNDFTLVAIQESDLVDDSNNEL